MYTTFCVKNLYIWPESACTTFLSPSASHGRFSFVALLVFLHRSSCHFLFAECTGQIMSANRTVSRPGFVTPVQGGGGQLLPVEARRDFPPWRQFTNSQQLPMAADIIWMLQQLSRWGRPNYLSLTSSSSMQSGSLSHQGATGLMKLLRTLLHVSGLMVLVDVFHCAMRMFCALASTFLTCRIQHTLTRLYVHNSSVKVSSMTCTMSMLLSKMWMNIHHCIANLLTSQRQSEMLLYSHKWRRHTLHVSLFIWC